MEQSLTAGWLSEMAEPLHRHLGGGLTISRLGNTVRWGFEGRSTLIDLLADGQLRAIFIDGESIDNVSNRPAVAAYQSQSVYSLTQASCVQMSRDMVDFFLGVREPKFSFIDVYAR